MYNFTIYESFRQNGYCYFWEEQHGKRGSNEIASNLYEYLRMVDQLESIKEIKFFCDNCTGQKKECCCIHNDKIFFAPFKEYKYNYDYVSHCWSHLYAC